MQLMSEFSQVGTSASSGTCYRCRSHERHNQPIVSTGISIDMEGLVEFCHQCVVEMASLYGFIVPERAQALRETNRRLGQQLQAEMKQSAALVKQVEALQDQVEALKPLKK